MLSFLNAWIIYYFVLIFTLQELSGRLRVPAQHRGQPQLWLHELRQPPVGHAHHLSAHHSRLLGERLQHGKYCLSLWSASFALFLATDYFLHDIVFIGDVGPVSLTKMKTSIGPHLSLNHKYREAKWETPKSALL